MSSHPTELSTASSEAALQRLWQAVGRDDLGGEARPDRLDGALHLWAFPLAGAGAAAAADAELLSPDEAARAERFRFERDRGRFIAGRATLRRILASYLDAEPRSLSFSYGPAGKPEIAGPQATDRLSFNLSNSADWALLAVNRGRCLGVDLERIPDAEDLAPGDLAAVAKRFFAAAEAAALAAYDPPLYAEAFCAIWTRKEALLKAFGAGLSLPLDGFCVSTDPRQPARLLSTEFRPAEAQRWSLHDVALEPPLAGQFRAALAVEGGLPVCRCFRLG